MKRWLTKLGWPGARLDVLDAGFSPAWGLGAGAAATHPIGRRISRPGCDHSYFPPIRSFEEGTCKG